MNFVIFKHEHGISLNQREYLLDEPDGDWMVFDSHQEAKDFLLDNGFDAEVIDDGIYIEDLEDAKEWEDIP